jgi:hypothetical protein
MEERKDKPEQCCKEKTINTRHAWRGTWNRPMKIDEDSLDPLTVARMTDHNVRGGDEEEKKKKDPPSIVKTG